MANVLSSQQWPCHKAKWRKHIMDFILSPLKRLQLPFKLTFLAVYSLTISYYRCLGGPSHQYNNTTAIFITNKVTNAFMQHPVVCKLLNRKLTGVSTCSFVSEIFWSKRKKPNFAFIHFLCAYMLFCQAHHYKLQDLQY